MTSREDVHCPACPNPETAFRIEDVGMKVDTDMGGTGLTFSATRLAWEPIMLAHLEAEDDVVHRRVYDQCVAELRARGVSAEVAARQDVQRVADWTRDSLVAGLKP